MDHKMVKIISLEELLYYTMFSLLISLKGLGLDEGTTLFRLGLGCATVLFGVKIMVGKYSVKELFMITLGVLWGTYVFFNVGSFSIFIYALIIFGMKNILVSKVMKVGTGVYAICFFTTVTLAIFFDRSGVLLVHEKFGLGPILRESLGYTHPNVLHVTYIVLMAFVLYNIRRENTLKTVVALMLGNIFVFLYSLSYTGVMISGILVCIYIYFTYRKNISKVEQMLIKGILPLCIVTSTVIAYFVDGKANELLNKLFNNRIWAIKVFFDLYEQTALGQKITAEGFSLDNSYIFALAWYGVCFFIVVIISYWILINKYLQEERRKELAVVIAFLAAGMTEQFLFNASIKNITLVFLGDVIFRSNRGKKKELQLCSKYNRVFELDIYICSQIWERIKKLNWKNIVLRYVMILVPTLLVTFFISTNKYYQVYVNERLCDCGGETVSSELVTQTEDTIIVGNAKPGNQYYYFSKENSNLITIMDYRYKLSLSLYLSAFITMVVVGISEWRKRIVKN